MKSIRVRQLWPMLACLLVLAVMAPERAGAVTWPDNLVFKNPVVIMTTTLDRLPQPPNEKTPFSVMLYVLDVSGTDQTVQLSDGNGSPNLNSTAVALTAEVHIRGGSTASLPKHQFSVKLTADWPSGTGNGNFLGMEYGGSHWVFNAPGFIDISMIRNVMAFDMQRVLGQNTGSNAWAPRTKYFEFFMVFNQPADTPPTVDQIINGQHIGDAGENEPNYTGVYINMEHIRADSQRVPIPTTYAPVTDAQGNPGVGGLLLQINDADADHKQLAGGSGAVANTGEPMNIEWPDAAHFDSSQAHQDQLAAVNNWYYHTDQSGQALGWASLFNNTPNGCITPPATPNMTTCLGGGLTVTEYWETIVAQTDLDSLAEYLLLNELAKDPDGYHRSTFMYRQPDTLAADGSLVTGKIYAGPLWDKNKSYGNDQAYCGSGPQTAYNAFYYSDRGWLFSPPGWSQAPWWWTTLAKYAPFQDRVAQIWLLAQRDGTGAFNLGRIESRVNAWKSYLLTTGSYARDYERWGYKGAACDPDSILDQEVTNLLSYLAKRIFWLAFNIKNLGLSMAGFHR